MIAPVLALALLGTSGASTPLPGATDQAAFPQGQEPGKGGKQDPDKGKGKKEEGEKAQEGKEHAEGGWLTDHAAALAAAKKDKRQVLMVFTGSDWCPPCKQLHSTVFESEAFKKWAEKRVVLLELDFPRSKELPKELKEQNQKLQKEFNVSGYPTVIALDAKGKKLFQQVGFGGGSAEDWIKKFEKELAKKK
jgi:thioredoxin-related protein